MWAKPTLEEYVAVSDRLAVAVSNWVAECFAGHESASVAETVSLLTRYFNDNFSYLLNTSYGKGGIDPLVEFMERREGHCTLFASTAALMLRYRGIPTRVVAGYYCSELHPCTGRWVVRERDGHAWCEAWDRGSGRWLLVEATPPAGLPAEYKPPTQLSLLGEWIMAQWRKLVDYIREANPLFFVAELLADLFGWLWRTVRSVRSTASLTILALLSLLARLRRRERADKDDERELRLKLQRRMAKLERRYVPAELCRQPHEAWSCWLQRIETSLPEARLSNLRELLERYQELRYGVSCEKREVEAWLGESRGRAGV